MPSSGAQKITYDSQYRYSVDANRRVQLPPPYRSAKPVEFTMIVWPQHETGPFLRVLPPDEMVKLREQIATLPTAEKTMLKRHIGNFSARVRVDGANRLAIPAEMAEAVGIRDEVMFAGMLDYFEIWPPARYAEMTTLKKSGVERAIGMLE